MHILLAIFVDLYSMARHLYTQPFITCAKTFRTHVVLDVACTRVITPLSRKIILPWWKPRGDYSCSQQVMGSKAERMVWIDLEVCILYSTHTLSICIFPVPV